MFRRVYSSDLTRSKRATKVISHHLRIIPVVFALSMLLPACSLGPSTPSYSTPSSSPTSSTGFDPITGTSYPPAAPVPLAQSPWCRYNKQEPRFWDYGGSASATPTIVTNWTQIQAQLGFTIYLPAKLSVDVCLTGVEGDIHLPQGNTFRITYDYYQRTYHNRIILSERPTSASQTKMQCESLTNYDQQDTTHFPIAPLENIIEGDTNTSSNPAPSICEGQVTQTLILFQAPENPGQLAADFQALQPNIAFIPTCHCQNNSEHVNRIHIP